MKAASRPAGLDPAMQPGSTNQDLHMKMSKKIAQLTKVIFHLNTRNEDHEKEVIGLQRSYETEIDQILKDAYAKMTNYRNQVANEFDREAYEKRIANMERLHREELDQTKAAIADIERNTAEHQSQTEREARNRIDKITTSVHQLRDDFSNRIKSLQAAVRNAESCADERIKIAELKAKTEVEAVVKSSNEQYNAMLAEKCRDEDRLRVRLANERALALDVQRKQYETKLAAFESEKAGVLEELENVRSTSSAEIRRLQEEFKEVQTLLAKQRQSRTVAEREAEQQLQEIKLDHERALEQLRLQIANQGHQLKAVQAAAENERKVLNESLTREMQKQRDSYDSQITELNARYSQYQEAKERTMRELRIGYETELAQLKKDLDDAETRASKFVKEIEETKWSLEQREQECGRLRNGHHELRIQSEQTVSRLKMEHETFVMTLKAAHEKALRTLNEEHRVDRESHEKHWMAQLKGSSEAAVVDRNREREQFLDQISEMKKELDNSKNELAERTIISDKKMKDLEDRHNAEITGLNSQLVECKNVHSRKIQALTKEKREEIESLRMDAENRVANIEKKAQEGIDLESEKWKAQTSAMQQRFEAKLQEVRNAFGLQLEQMRKENENGDECKKKLESELICERQQRSQSEQLVEELEEELSNAIKEIDEMKCKLAETQRNYDDFKSESRKQWELEKLQLLDEFDFERSSAASTLTTTQLQHEKELVEFEQKHNNDIKRINQEYQKRLESSLDRERESSVLRIAEQLSKQRSEFEARIQELTSVHEEKLKAAVKRELRLKEEAIENEAMVANLRFDEERAKYRATIAQTEKQCEDRILQMEKQINIKNDEVFQHSMVHKKELNELQVILHAKNVELNRARSNQLTLERKIASMEEEAKQITARYNSSTERLEKENRWALQRQKSEFDVVKAGFEQDLANLRAQIDEVENRFRNRESRREDLEKIAELERLSIQQQKIVDQSITDMNMFKLELQNRDKNYNERFAAAPRVGTMQVVKPKPKTRRRSTLPALMP